MLSFSGLQYSNVQTGKELGHQSGRNLKSNRRDTRDIIRGPRPKKDSVWIDGRQRRERETRPEGSRCERGSIGASELGGRSPPTAPAFFRSFAPAFGVSDLASGAFSGSQTPTTGNQTGSFQLASAGASELGWDPPQTQVARSSVLSLPRSAFPVWLPALSQEAKRRQRETRPEASSWRAREHRSIGTGGDTPPPRSRVLPICRSRVLRFRSGFRRFLHAGQLRSK